VLVNGVEVATLRDGQAFGELALLYDTNRQATVRAMTHSTAFALDRSAFRYIVAHSFDSRRGEVQRTLTRVPLLEGLTKQQIMRISDSVEIIRFKPEDYIIRKGSEGNIFYMIKDGTVRVINVGASEQFRDHELGPGDYFGERALITGEPRAADVVAVTPVTLLALDRELFNSLLGPLREVLDHNLNLRIIESVKLFSSLTDREKALVARSFEHETFAAGSAIVREGDKGRKFYIMKEGTAVVTVGGKEVGQLIPGQYFGEMAELDDQVRKATVTAQTACECFTLDRPAFHRILGSVRGQLEEETKERKVALSGAASPGEAQPAKAPSSQDEAAARIEFSQLSPIAVLGSGTFGRVSLVQHKPSGNVYALKAMLKSEIELHKQQVNVMNEKELMLMCNHPFVLRLYKTFKDSRRLYMLLEFVQGGELFSVLHTPRGDGVSDASAKFYGAGVLLALIHLHQRDIAYRDMKPVSLIGIIVCEITDEYV
jgi:cGMP-dependent protein kinase